MWLEDLDEIEKENEKYNNEMQQGINKEKAGKKETKKPKKAKKAKKPKKAKKSKK